MISAKPNAERMPATPPPRPTPAPPAAPRGAAAKPKKEAAPAAAPAAPAGPAVFPSAVDAKYSKETAGKARMHTCVDQYNANKASNANGGMKWIQKGGGYYSECNKKLKGCTLPPAGAAGLHRMLRHRALGQKRESRLRAGRPEGTSGRQIRRFSARIAHDSKPQPYLAVSTGRRSHRARSGPADAGTRGRPHASAAIAVGA